MNRSFTFIKPVYLQVLDMVWDLVPEAIEARMLCFDKTDHQIYYIARKSNSELDTNLSLPDDIVENMRKHKALIKWSNTFPSEEVAQNTRQLDVFDEYQNTILELRFYNEEDNKNDVLFLKFSDKLPGLNLKNDKLDAISKHIIGNMAYNAVKSHMNIARLNIDALNHFNGQTHKIIRNTREISQKLAKTQEKYALSVYRYAVIFLNELSLQHDIDITFSGEAAARIQKYEGDLEALKNQIREAVDYVMVLHSGNTESIIIEDSFLNFDQNTKTIEENILEAINPEGLQDRHKKTFELLNKLEKALSRVMKQGLETTSANVGAACDKPVTAAAISDALKKHKKKIHFLVASYPEAWPSLRNEFRPFQNILAQESSSPAVSKSA
jgi:hypothetical protein